MKQPDPLPAKKIIVASFQRSGTHFLINTLASNFVGVPNGWVDIVHGRKNPWVQDVNARNLISKIKEQLVDAYAPSSDRRCVKTHYQAYFLERNLNTFLRLYDVFYILRDPRDTMVACYHYYNKTNFESFIKEPNFAKFLRTPLWDVATETNPFSYSYVKPKHIVDKWNKHVLSWLPYRDRGVTFIRYDTLLSSLEGTLMKIEAATCQRRKGPLQPVLISDSRYRPDFVDGALPRGKVGVWKDYFSQDDLDFLRDNLSNDVKTLFDDHLH